MTATCPRIGLTAAEGTRLPKRVIINRLLRVSLCPLCVAAPSTFLAGTIFGSCEALSRICRGHQRLLARRTRAEAQLSAATQIPSALARKLVKAPCAP